MAAQRLLNEALPHRVRTAAGDWRLGRTDLDGALANASEQIASVGRGAGADERRIEVECLQESMCRSVLRSPIHRSALATCVIKIFYLPGIKRKMRHWRYGLPEAVNLVRAHRSGIRVPQVYGFGRVFLYWRIPLATVLVMEDLTGYRAVREQLKSDRSNYDATTAIVDAVTPLFVTLFHACCNHIDMHSHNIMLPVPHGGGAPALIDFEHATFGTKPSLDALAQQAGKFARSCQRIVPELAMDAWFQRLLDTVAVADPVRRRRLVERFHFCRAHQLSIAERLNPEACAA